MKKFLLSVLLCVSATTAMMAENMAVSFPAPTNFGVKGAGQAPRMTVSETVLGVNRPTGNSWLAVTNSFTMQAWIKLDAISNDYAGMNLMGHQPQDHINFNGSFFLSVPRNTNTIKLGGKYNSGATGFDIATGFNADTQNWHFYSIVYDAPSSTISVYIDGEKKGEQKLGGNLQLYPDNPGVLFFGSCNPRASYDEAHIYSTALTADQIKTSMNNPNAVGNLVCYYTFDAVASGTTGQFENHGSNKAVKAVYAIGNGTNDEAGVISCGTNHTETAPTLVAGRTITGIADITVDSNAPVRMFNLSGVEVNAGTATPGLYIRTQGGRSEKVLVK